MCVVTILSVWFGSIYCNRGIEGVIAIILAYICALPIIFLVVWFLNWLMDY